MNYVVLLFGVLVILGSAMLLIRPKYIFGIFAKYKDRVGLQMFAIGVRLLLGIALLMSASASRYPTTMQVLGWITLVAVIILGGIGRERFKKMIAWASTLSKSAQRVAAVVGLLLGIFFIYAVL